MRTDEYPLLDDFLYQADKMNLAAKLSETNRLKYDVPINH